MAATVYTSQEPIFFPRSHDTHMSLAGPGVGLFLPLRVVVMVVRDLSGTRRFVHLQTLALSRPRLPTTPCGTVCIIYTYMMCVVCSIHILPIIAPYIYEPDVRMYIRKYYVCTIPC